MCVVDLFMLYLNYTYVYADVCMNVWACAAYNADRLGIGKVHSLTDSLAAGGLTDQ